jgi:alpha-tubulin suppressor-like RCC1 family protein
VAGSIYGARVGSFERKSLGEATMNIGVRGNGCGDGTLTGSRLTELARPLLAILSLSAIFWGTPAWAIHGSVIAAGAYHTCAVSRAGAVQCWGENAHGALGNGKTANSSTPVAVSGLSSGVVAIAAGQGHTCALTSAGAVQCWGDNEFGQLGNGSHNAASRTPVPISRLSNGVVAIAAGAYHTCALTHAGAVQCWGENAHGELGNGTNTISSTPLSVSGLSNGVVAIAAGQSHTCALASARAGGLQCWGDNEFGQLGNGRHNAISRTPVAVTQLSNGIVEVAAGAFHTCALTSVGVVQCWGENAHGELGNGTNTISSTPLSVSGLSSGVVAVAAGRSHTCVLTNAGAMQCWGDNEFGQLGNGRQDTISRTPVAVSRLPSGVVAVAAGDFHTCALTSAGATQCWGENTYGELGNGTNTNSSTPVAVSGLTADTGGHGAGPTGGLLPLWAFDALGWGHSSCRVNCGATLTSVPW